MPHCAPTSEEIHELVTAVLGGVAGDDRAVPNEMAPSVGAEGIVVAPDLHRGEVADVAIGSDHGGFHLKRRIAAELADHGFTVQDHGTEGTDPVDYPDYALAVARAVAGREARWGIAVDGAGIGSAITANKVPGIRAATCWDVSSAKNSREHNHANVLCLGAGLVGESLALQIVRAWLSTAWGGGRHARRVSKIGAIERLSLGATVR